MEHTRTLLTLTIFLEVHFKLAYHYAHLLTLKDFSYLVPCPKKLTIETFQEMVLEYLSVRCDEYSADPEIRKQAKDKKVAFRRNLEERTTLLLGQLATITSSSQFQRILEALAIALTSEIKRIANVTYHWIKDAYNSFEEDRRYELVALAARGHLIMGTPTKGTAWIRRVLSQSKNADKTLKMMKRHIGRFPETEQIVFDLVTMYSGTGTALSAKAMFFKFLSYQTNHATLQIGAASGKSMISKEALLLLGAAAAMKRAVKESRRTFKKYLAAR